MLETFSKFKTELEADATPVAKVTEEVKEVSLASATVDGVTIEAEMFEVGQAVFAVTEEGEKMPLPEGDYKTEEGNMFSVDAEGVIVSIGEPEAEAVEEEVAEQDMNSEAQAAKKVIESQTVSKETFFSAIAELKTELTSEIEALKNAHKAELSAKDAELDELKTKLSATPSESKTTVAPVSEKPRPIAPKAKGVGRTTMDRVHARMFSNN